MQSRDLAAQRKMEAALTEERNLLRTLIDNLPDAVFVKDLECRKIIANPVDVRSMGAQSEAEVIGKTDHVFYSAETAATSFAEDQSVIQSGVSILGREGYYFDKQGNKLNILSFKIPLRNEYGTIVGIVGATHDITEQKRAQEALQHERTILRTLIDNIPDGIYVKDIQCRKVIANLADVHNIGLQSEAEVLGKDDFDLFPKELAEGFIVDDRIVIQTGKPVINREEYVIDEQGKKRWLLTTKLPLRDEKGQTIGLVGIGRDITAQKKAEAERERLITELQDALADVKLLSGLVPICANCKKIRDDQGYWTQIESYIQDRSDAKFSHSICPDCAAKLYPDYIKKK
jgi:PAS domain S-box-containing protein